MTSIINFLSGIMAPPLGVAPEGWLFYAVNAGFTFLYSVFVWLAYYSFRRGLGHEKYKGYWHSAENIRRLKQELYQGAREGRFADEETMAFLARYAGGKES